MDTKRTGSILALLTVVALALAPAASAHPINPSLNWLPQNFGKGLSTTGTATVSIDADCPSGQTFMGVITVVEPDSVSTSTFSVGPTPCGTNVNVVYPTGFTGTAGTTEIGTYVTTWAGSTSAVVGGIHPTFSITDAFTVTSLPPPVPEFPMPVMLVAAVGLALMAGMRKVRVLKV